MDGSFEREVTILSSLISIIVSVTFKQVIDLGSGEVLKMNLHFSHDTN